MPEIVFTRPRDVTIPGFEQFNDNVRLAGTVTVCELLNYDANGGVRNPAGNARPKAVALHSGVAGDHISVGYKGEVAGFDTTGIAPGDEVGASAVVPGGWATGAQRVAGGPIIGQISPDGERIVFDVL